MTYRLGLFIGKEHPSRSFAAVGWAVLGLPDCKAEVGKIKLDKPPKNGLLEKKYSPAEFTTLLEYCGLSQKELSDYSDVDLRSVQYWISDRTAPTGVIAELNDLRTQLEFAADQILQKVNMLLSDNPSLKKNTLEAIDLYRYKQSNYKNTQQFKEGLPHGAHNKLIELTAEILGNAGFEVSILYK